ncbi:MAG: Omp28-related outer membrane protein [Bacteroidales bacterium]|jgi:hypothetical protein|nr:Omp28-related outer membrane protein [Bacteroidales bacterium]
MKKYIAFCLGILFLVVSCDKIEGPYYQEGDGFFIDDFPPLNTETIYRKILIEEFTGHTCVNCPHGHQRIAELLDIYGDTIVPISIHVGATARPLPNSIFTYDFRTNTGTQIEEDFLVESNPSALFNRTQFNNRWTVSVNQWQNAILSFNRHDVTVAIQVQTERRGNRLNVNTKTTLLKEYNKPVQLAIYLIEDDIIKPQQNGSSRIDTFYHHKHVLRDAKNGAYGLRLPTSQGGILQKDSSYLYGFTFPFNEKDWVMENTTTVVFLLDPATREVLQVEVVKN